jgi:hypothetical protein
MNEPPTPKKPECRRCGAMFCSCSEVYGQIEITEFEEKKIEFNMRALKKAKKELDKKKAQGRLPDLSMFPLKNYSS